MANIGISSGGLHAFVRDASQGDLTLSLLERLARALACSLHALLAVPGPDEASPHDGATEDEGPAADAATLGQLLWASAILTPIATLAEITT